MAVSSKVPVSLALPTLNLMSHVIEAVHDPRVVDHTLLMTMIAGDLLAVVTAPVVMVIATEVHPAEIIMMSVDDMVALHLELVVQPMTILPPVGAATMILTVEIILHRLTHI